MKKTKGILFRFLALAVVSALCVGAFAARRKSEGAIPQTDTARGARDAATFLFLGTDRAVGLCDVIMLVRADYTDGALTVLQIPRDTYAAYTDKSYKKLNGAYSALGGGEAVAAFLENAMSIEIDHYVCMGLDTLCKMVDVLGGIDIDVPCDMRYSDPEQGLYIDIKKGTNHLDGESAEKFVRYRASYTEGDIARLDAQKLFMAAFIEKASENASVTTVMKLCAAADGVETDLSFAELAENGVKALKIDKSNVSMLTLPGAEATATQSGASYYVLSAPATAEITERVFGRADGFDKDRVFLNTVYKSFCDIYATYAEYKAYSVCNTEEIDIKAKR